MREHASWVGRGQSIAALVLLTLVVGYAVIKHGGDDPFDSSLSLFLLGLLAVTVSVFVSASRASILDRAVVAAALLFPAYIAFQLVPLPPDILTVVSPTRAEVASALGNIVPAPRFAPLTLSPSSTSLHLARVTGCVLILLMVRQLARQSARGRWATTVPLIGLGVMEAATAFAQSLSGAQVVGSYYNRNHLAGLIEMVMPFAAVYGVAVLFRSKRRGLTAFDAARACCGLGLALAMFIAILFSLSKGGTFAALGSLVVMGVVAAEGRASGWRRWALTAGLVLACALTLVFLTPAALVERFAALGSDDVSEGRLPIWKDTLQMIRAYPLFGVGMGNFYPGILRYQTAGLGLAWTAAHNDYLQFLSELGIVGFVLPALVVGGAFVRAARAAIAGSSREAHEVGLACAGGLSAFLIHSLSDFNAYVLSNAMVVAWIAGIASTLSAPPAGNAVEWPTAIRSVTRVYVAGVGCVLTAYTGAWLIFLHSFQSDPAIERVFCRFGVCDSESALDVLRGSNRDAEPPAVPVEDLVEYLRRDPAAPFRWQDLGEALQKTGRIDRARYCLFRAVALAPNSPATLLDAAKFQLDQGEQRAALDLVSRSLRANAGDPLDETSFRILEKKQVPGTDVLQCGLPDRRSARAYLRWLFKSDRVADVDQVWQWMVARRDADDKLANEYTEYRIRSKQLGAAARGWALYAKTKSAEYPDANRIFNGGFESDPIGNRFDWRIDARSGMAIELDEAVRASGRRSLRIRFDGTQNPGDIGVEQTVFLPAGRYHFEAHVRTEDVSTDQGVAFRIVSEDKPQALDVTTDNVRGSSDWTMVERIFDAPPGGGLARVSVVRKPSLKFDNLIKGTAWIDQVSISPARR